jgi:hypothetical protein
MFMAEGLSWHEGWRACALERFFGKGVGIKARSPCDSGSIDSKPMLFADGKIQK